MRITDRCITSGWDDLTRAGLSRLAVTAIRNFRMRHELPQITESTMTCAVDARTDRSQVLSRCNWMVDALYLQTTCPPARRRQGFPDASCPTDRVTRWHDPDDDFAHLEHDAGSIFNGL